MAQLKMELVGLDKFFTLPGAFGDESHNRRDLPATRCGAHSQTSANRSRAGAVHRDRRHAKRHRLRASLRRPRRRSRHRPNFLREEILACKPDALLPDLSDVELVLKTLERL